MAAKPADYYETLQVSKTATQEEIKQAFRKLARQHHPDLHPEKDKDQHTRRMQEINEAYTVLGSKENRAKYDQFGEHWKDGPPPPPPPPRSSYGNEETGSFSGQGSEGFSDFFRRMFQQDPGEPGAGEPMGSELDVEAALELSLEEALKGVEKTFTLVAEGVCPNCHGTGRIKNDFCPVCGGAGELRRPREVKANIPAGLIDNSRIRLKGQGNEGPRGRGDLYLRIRLRPDPRFTLDGKNVEAELRVMAWTAALGGEVPVPTLEGPLRIRIPKGTHTGKRLRLAGKGLGKPGERGDLFIRITLDIPDTLSPKAEALLKQLEEETHDQTR